MLSRCPSVPAVLALALAGCGATTPSAAHASAPGAPAAAAPPGDPAETPSAPAPFDAATLERLNHAQGPLRSNGTLPGREGRYGHAEVLVHAPLADVRKLVQDYARYKDFNTRFQTSRVIAKRAGRTDVYMQVPIMGGVLTLWNVTRFPPARVVAPGLEVVEGRHVKGNLKDLHVVWTLRALGDAHTVLTCDLLLVLNIAAPQDMVDEELRDAAAQGVDTIWTRAQNGQRVVVPYHPARDDARQSAGRSRNPSL